MRDKVMLSDGAMIELTNRPDMDAEFFAFHYADPTLFLYFREYAEKARQAGKTKYSASAIVQDIRWNTGIHIKVSDHFRTRYARLLVFQHPEFAGFFDFKESSNPPDGEPGNTQADMFK